MHRLAVRGPALAGALLLSSAGSLPAADCAGVSPVSGTALTSVTVATGVTGRPLYVTSPPGDLDRLFIVEQDGRIRIKKRGDPPSTLTTFLDISSRVQASPSLNEMGLLGLAFDPGYATNGFFYVNYTEGLLGGPWFTVVARYSVTPGDPDSADFDSEERLLRFSQPQANHNGGQVFFGADGFLYVASGDGGGGGDTHGTCGNGQNRATLLGKMLRLDVADVDPNSLAPDCGGASAAYRIPSTNPFANGLGGNCDEIWSYGLRNPWRSSFDALTGDLYIADVGQNCTEEVNFSAGGGAGANYGWRQMEGSHCFDRSNQSNCNPNPVACAGSPPCLDPSLTLPVKEFSHAEGCSVTGGYVYRGCLMPDVAGRYFYGDFCAGFVRSFVISGGVATDPNDHTPQVAPGGVDLTSFGVDEQGEIYIVNRLGSVTRIVPPFANMEVSGPGAALQFVLGAASWTWEDLEFSTMHPVTAYRVYRGTPGGSFQCVRSSPIPSWPAGDPAVPPLGGLFAYLVTAVNPSGQQTRSGSPASTLLPAACP